MSADKFILRHAYGKEIKVYVQPWPNPITGRFADHVKIPLANGDLPPLTDRDKEVMTTGGHIIKSTDVFELHDGKEFDMSDPYQKAVWDAIKYNEVIAADRTERDKNGNLVVDGDRKRYGKADLYIERPDAISNTTVNKRELVLEAGNYIMKDSQEGIVSKCKLLGQFTTNRTINSLKEYLYSIAEKKPKEIIDLYTGSDTSLRLLIIDALDKDIIKKRDGIYYFGDSTIMGTDTNIVVAFLKNPDNKKILDTIRSSVTPSSISQDNLSDDSGQIESTVKRPGGRPSKSAE